MPSRPIALRTGRARFGAPALGALVLVLLLLVPPAVASPPAATPAPSAARAAVPAPLPNGPNAATAAVPSAEVGSASSPSVTALYDWDPQPFILPLGFPIEEVAGVGAVMATSDLYGTVVLFGGEGIDGLTNLTITVNESSALWTIAPIPPGPTPRANASFVTVDGGRYAVLFGGVMNLTTDATDNQTWVWDFANRSWINRTQPIAPPPRESAAMAADLSGSSVVLEGGWDPDYTVGGAGASVTWNDTWVLNLTTFNWTREGPSNAPRPMYGSAMVYAPTVGAYLLFGGCSSSCSNALYSYTIGGNWTRTSEKGDIPAPEGGSTAAWSPNWAIEFLTGGFQFGGNTLIPLNESYVYTPTTHTWDLIADTTPAPRYAAAASFLDANQCPGLFLVGGSYALTNPPPDGWFLDANPDLGSGCNNWGGDQVGGGGGGLSNCTPTTFLNVTVIDSATGLPIPNAGVQVSGSCGTLSLPTDANGQANFTAMPNETVRVIATSADYHSNSTFVNLSLPATSYLVIRLVSLPTVDIQVLGKNYPDLIVPLFNASVVLAPELPLGQTNADGWFNLSGFSGPQGPNTFLAYATNYSNGSATVNIPYTGPVVLPIILLAYGAFDVLVVEYPDGTPIAGATGIIDPVGAYTFGGAFTYTTGASGWFNTTLPQSNYSVTAAHSGFVSNATRLPVFHPWVDPSVIVLNLTLLRGADVSVRLLDAHTHRPIGTGAVRVGYLPYENTSRSGWANFTNILPPGWYNVVGSAPTYEPNATAVDLTYLESSVRITLNLTPIPGCTKNCITGVNETTGPFRLLPTDQSELDVYVLAPVVLVLAGALYALYVRRRAGASP